MKLHLAFTVLFASYLASCDALKQLHSVDQEDAERWNSGFDGRSLTSDLGEEGVRKIYGTGKTGKSGKSGKFGKTTKSGKSGKTTTPDRAEPELCYAEGENCTDPAYECVCDCLR